MWMVYAWLGVMNLAPQCGMAVERTVQTVRRRKLQVGNGENFHRKRHERWCIHRILEMSWILCYIAGREKFNDIRCTNHPQVVTNSPFSVLICIEIFACIYMYIYTHIFACMYRVHLYMYILFQHMEKPSFRSGISLGSASPKAQDHSQGPHIRGRTVLLAPRRFWALHRRATNLRENFVPKNLRVRFL